MVQVWGRGAGSFEAIAWTIGQITAGCISIGQNSLDPIMGRMVNSSYWRRPKMMGRTSHVQVPASHVQRLARRVPTGTLAMFVCQVRCGCVGQSVESLGSPWDHLWSRHIERPQDRQAGLWVSVHLNPQKLDYYIYYSTIDIYKHYEQHSRFLLGHSNFGSILTRSFAVRYRAKRPGAYLSPNRSCSVVCDDGYYKNDSATPEQLSASEVSTCFSCSIPWLPRKRVAFVPSVMIAADPRLHTPPAR